jgi:hypothetical protein
MFPTTESLSLAMFVLVYNLSVEQYLLFPTGHYKFHLYYVMMFPCTCASIYGSMII